MKCPFCDSTEMIISNSRETHSGYTTWRRRKCIHCLNIFTTYEKVNLNYIIVSKRNNKKQRYSHEKLFSSILNSFLKLKKADTGDSAKYSEECTNEIEKIMVEKKTKNISTREIHDIAIEVLIKKDPCVAMNYISYFNKSEDKEKLEKILKKYISTQSH